ncbi:Autophagy-related protein 27 [Ceratocystis lukuohia]|uniref:Autophagy-related protein 27 n=3 Tax=Ceratocystis TaxID=5157 RepID=A0A0F8D1D7_CERFI|nr:Autophagy-related protein 27 [Ceratocystis platani]PHH55237.1 Autophagy-related protein 27 [Ceratocystis fimbriata CBS 114723]
MRWSLKNVAATGLLLAPTSTLAAASLQCDSILANNHKYDLSPLRGPHSVVTTITEKNAIYNTTYTIDLCAPLKRVNDGSIPAREQCPEGTRVCAVQRALHGKADGENVSSDADDDDKDKDKSSEPYIREAVPLAGALESFGGAAFEYTTTKLDGQENNGEGFLLNLPGGVFPLDVPHKEQFPKKTVVRFLCDTEKTGLEGEWQAEVEYANATSSSEDNKSAKMHKARNDAKDAEKQFVNDGAALLFDSYQNEGPDATGTLHLTWKSKYACRSVPPAGGTQGWGFFTWFIVLAFMIISAYLIFGSWLNYTRYGARGWDLLPHSDTIRDVPFLMHEFTRKVLSTVQNSGSRGGYSAV